MPVTAPQFNQAVITDVLGSVVALCQQIGRFNQVNGHEPVGAPQQQITAAVWINSIVPIAKGSGLNVTSGSLNLRVRIYMPFRTQPYDMIDPDILTAVAEIMGAVTGDFEFTSTAQAADNIRGVDIFGGLGSGERLDARAGYLEMDRKVFRIVTIRLPIVINDMFVQGV